MSTSAAMMDDVEFPATLRPASSVRDRLVQAADSELFEYGTLSGRFDAVARRAGVSRATAYRQIGSVGELMTQVGLKRARRHVIHTRLAMEREHGALEKIRAALVYTTHALPHEAVVLALISRQSGAPLDPEVNQLTAEVLSPVLAAGQQAGEIRTDVELQDVVEYLTEQTYLLASAADRSTEAVAHRFRSFIAPALSPSSAPMAHRRVTRST